MRISLAKGTALRWLEFDEADVICVALKFHPDRNQGHEQEVIAKFQAIQAAHEVLSDSQQRLKYDTERLRAGYGKLYGPAKTAARKPQPHYSPSYASAAPPKTQGSRFPCSSCVHSGERLAPNCLSMVELAS